MRLTRLKRKGLLISPLLAAPLLAAPMLAALLLAAPLMAAEPDTDLSENTTLFSIHLPTVAKVFPVLTFEQVWTASEEGEPKKAFLPGESLQITAGGQNSANNEIPVILTWSVEDSCGEIISGSQHVNLESGNWTLPQLVEGSDCKGIYTFSMQLDHQNQSTSLSSSFVVIDPSNLEFQNGQAFDKCNVASVSEMQTWWDQSPYVGTNLYIGGISRYCPNTQLNASWIYQVSQQGWSFIPTWVGPQAPCSGFKYRMSWDTDIAYQQGRQEAEAANATLINLGFLGDRIVYYDVEAYSTSVGLDECRNAVNWFLKGWTERLNELGTQSGAYGSPCGSYVSDWDEIIPGPEYVWLAAWKWPREYDPDASVWGLNCLSDELWADQQRIRQYAGDHNETYGGVTFNIDSNVVESDITIIPGETLTSEPRTAGPMGTTLNRLVIEDMGLLSGDMGWLLVNQRLYMTQQGGNSWTDITPDLTFENQILGVFFLDESAGWLVSQNGETAKLKLYATADGGETWQASPLEVQDGLVDIIYAGQVQFIDQQYGWISFKFQSSRNFSLGRLLKTTDGGKSWVEIPQPIGGVIHFINEQVGRLEGGASGGENYFSRDGGATWEAMADSPLTAHSLLLYDEQPYESRYLENLPGPAQIVNFVDENTGWAWVQSTQCSGDKVRSGENGDEGGKPFLCEFTSSLMKTEDGGQTWVEVDLGIFLSG